MEVGSSEIVHQRSLLPGPALRCPAGHDFERFYSKISDSPSETACPECGAMAERRISGGAGLLFKGSGFYITDYGKDGKKDQKSAPKAGAGGGEKADKGGDKGGASGDASSGGASSGTGGAAGERHGAGRRRFPHPRARESRAGD